MDGYVPSLHPKMCLIEACEAIERNNYVPEKTPQHDNHKRTNSGHIKSENKRNDEHKKINKKPLKHCSLHGQNTTHDSSECYALKNQAQKGMQQSSVAKTNSAQNFTARKFRKEINLLARKSSKKKVLELYACAVKREQQKLANKKKRGKSSKCKADESSSDSDSDSNVSIHMITQPPKKNQVPQKAKAKKARSETTDEESEYQKILRAKWLQDYGEEDTDAIINSDKDEKSKED